MKKIIIMSRFAPISVHAAESEITFADNYDDEKGIRFLNSISRLIRTDRKAVFATSETKPYYHDESWMKNKALEVQAQNHVYTDAFGY